MNMGLTGGIASGKSTVSRLLVQRGAALVDADKIAREVVEPGQPSLRLIAERFGQAVLLEDGSLNRKKLGEIVFSDPSEREALEQITHPAIRGIMKDRMADFGRENPKRLVVVDVPLLYESELGSLFHKVMVVYVPREVQLARLMERDRLGLEAARRRLDAQMDIEEKRKRADYVIDNSGSLEDTIRQIDDFWREHGQL
ncbi:dephospho-CoA kinase [Cohnella thailandensis]|uniref:Dephospho-CoA kinase n=1 Tax=Cohnella thailandensis TaxID=557557 RepID=A0A841T259_9BACL|nr:dephospho-CoA kinase [Cohnella thailandensis]MBB6635967.1 dephospho-CoA kinase [Cohnella thailandensis]MBP1976345.1 dephospho-CoA kinase [Cohnella thailandensis]